MQMYINIYVNGKNSLVAIFLIYLQGHVITWNAFIFMCGGYASYMSIYITFCPKVSGIT